MHRSRTPAAGPLALIAAAACLVCAAPAVADKPSLVMLIAEREYKTEQTLPKFAGAYLSDHFDVKFAGAPPEGDDRNRLTGAEAIADADVLLVSVRRRAFPEDQLALIRKHVADGKPVVGIRTASHAFDLRNAKPPAGHDVWPQWDREVIGGNYTGHHGADKRCRIVKAEKDLDHPILADIDIPFESVASLYKNAPLPEKSTPLLVGHIDGAPGEPIAWTHTSPGGGRVFYTSLGHVKDFEGDAFNLLLLNGIFWAAGLEGTDAHKAAAKPLVSAMAKPAGGAPAEALAQLRTPDDLAVDLLLHEPTVEQPVFLNFDERGRMWVVQYRQYPHPAGLKMESHDHFWRAVYDKRLPPPPYDTPEKRPFRGADRITIHEDTDGDGTFDSTKTFLDGLNITTAVVRGRGGVWVLTPPQLVFYPDANNDDVPDGDPVVHLDGFNLEDTHAVANSLRWGPDGWLYGAIGSTVSADIVRPGLDDEPIIHAEGQQIFRYHPETRRVEIYAEGGGNAFGVEIDEKGRVFSGHNGGDTRGFHYVQGGYYRKNFAKHGPLANPYAFGYFPHMAHHQAKRFTHNFVIYESDALPPRYRGKLIGVDPINRDLPVAEMTPTGATFRTKDVDRAIATDDQRFRPVDIKLGPDGNLYICDWHDHNVNHYRNHEGQMSPEDGRIYRVRAADAKPGYKPMDLSKRSSAELVELLRSDNRWQREQARRLLGDRRDAELGRKLAGEIGEAEGRFALDLLWAINLCGAFDEAVALRTLDHADPHVRLWTVRLLGDAGEVSAQLAQKLTQLAESDPHVEVRSQLAASAARLPADAALPVLATLARRDADAGDPFIPLQTWWALSSFGDSHRAEVVAMFASDDAWRHPIVRDTLGPRIMRRYATAGNTADLVTCEHLLRRAPGPREKAILLRGFEEAFGQKSLPDLPAGLVEAIDESGGGTLSLRVKIGNEAAAEQALAAIANPKHASWERRSLMWTFGRLREERAIPAVIGALHDGDDAVVNEALQTLAAFDDPRIAPAILDVYPELDEKQRERAQNVLAARPDSAVALLEAANAETVNASTLTPATVERLRAIEDARVVALADRLFGRVLPPQPAEVEREIRRLTDVVAAGTGNGKSGRQLYDQRCAACHTLHGAGGQIGPDLTAYNRDDVPSVLLATVNPSAEIREGYGAVTLTTTDGAAHVGFIAERDDDVVVIRGVTGESVSVPRGRIVALTPMPQSLMPPGLLTGLTDPQVRDLFAYLRSSTP